LETVRGAGAAGARVTQSVSLTGARDDQDGLPIGSIVMSHHDGRDVGGRFLPPLSKGWTVPCAFSLLRRQAGSVRYLPQRQRSCVSLYREARGVSSRHVQRKRDDGDIPSQQMMVTFLRSNGTLLWSKCFRNVCTPVQGAGKAAEPRRSVCGGRYSQAQRHAAEGTDSF
jgi:hypothetical protein